MGESLLGAVRIERFQDACCWIMSLYMRYVPPDNNEFPSSGYGPMIFVNRLVRTRMLGGVGRGGKPPLIPD